MNPGPGNCWEMPAQQSDRRKNWNLSHTVQIRFRCHSSHRPPSPKLWECGVYVFSGTVVCNFILVIFSFPLSEVCSGSMFSVKATNISKSYHQFLGCLSRAWILYCTGLCCVEYGRWKRHLCATIFSLRILLTGVQVLRCCLMTTAAIPCTQEII